MGNGVERIWECVFEPCPHYNFSMCFQPKLGPIQTILKYISSILEYS
jgi:hypothetical protein